MLVVTYQPISFNFAKVAGQNALTSANLRYMNCSNLPKKSLKQVISYGR